MQLAIVCDGKLKTCWALSGAVIVPELGESASRLRRGGQANDTEGPGRCRGATNVRRLKLADLSFQSLITNPLSIRCEGA